MGLAAGVAARAWAVVAAVVVALVVFVAGPDRLVVCGSGHVLDRTAQRVGRGFGAGHVDGPDASFCYVPSGTSWVVAGVALSGAAAYVLRRPVH